MSAIGRLVVRQGLSKTSPLSSPRPLTAIVRSIATTGLTKPSLMSATIPTGKPNVDFRDVRYLDKTKQVNQQPAIQLIHEVPPHEVEARFVWCNGGGGALGHPKIYINLDPPGPQPCGYCGLRFVKKEGGHSHGHH